MNTKCVPLYKYAVRWLCKYPKSGRRTLTRTRTHLRVGGILSHSWVGTFALAYHKKINIYFWMRMFVRTTLSMSLIWLLTLIRRMFSTTSGICHLSFYLANARTYWVHFIAYGAINAVWYFMG